MAFSVQPAALRGYAKLLDGQVHQVEAMHSYERNEIDADISWGGLLTLLGDVYPSMVFDLDESLSKAHGLLYESGRALADTATRYESTDHNSALRLDSTMPGKERGDVLPPEQREAALPFTPRRVPSGRLSPPGEYSDQFRWQMDILDAVGMSITAFVRQVIVSLAGWDPFEPVMRDWTGDWAKMRSVADAWHDMRHGFEDLGVNLVQGAQDLADEWHGNAAGACLTYLQRLSGSMHWQAEFCRFIYDRMVDAAEGAADMYKAASGLVSSAIDWAITAAVTAAAGTATIELYGIGVAGWVVAVVAIERMIKDLADAAEIISSFKNSLEGSVGLLKNLRATSFDGYQLGSLPNQPYLTPR